MIARRLRLAFLDVRVTDSILPRVADLMGEELGWDRTTRQVLLVDYCMLWASVFPFSMLWGLP